MSPFLERATVQALGQGYNTTSWDDIEMDLAGQASKFWGYFIWGLANSLSWMAAKAAIDVLGTLRVAAWAWLRPRGWRLLCFLAVRFSKLTGCRLPVFMLAGTHDLRLYRLYFAPMEGAIPGAAGTFEVWTCKLVLRLPHDRDLTVTVGHVDLARTPEEGRTLRVVEDACAVVFRDWRRWSYTHHHGVLDTSLLYFAGPPPQLQVGRRAPVSSLCRSLLRVLTLSAPDEGHIFYGAEAWI